MPWSPTWVHPRLPSGEQGDNMMDNALTKFTESVASCINIWTKLLVEISFSWRSLLVEYTPFSFFSIGLRAPLARLCKSTEALT